LCLVTTNEQFMCITNGGQVIRTEVSQVREVGRNTQGVRVMTLGESERVVDVAKLAEQDDETPAALTALVEGSELVGDVPPAADVTDAPEAPEADGDTAEDSGDADNTGDDES
jgi:DNA gyrase subunit A